MKYDVFLMAVDYEEHNWAGKKGTYHVYALHRVIFAMAHR